MFYLWTKTNPKVIFKSADLNAVVERAKEISLLADSPLGFEITEKQEKSLISRVNFTLQDEVKINTQIVRLYRIVCGRSFSWSVRVDGQEKLNTDIHREAIQYVSALLN